MKPNEVTGWFADWLVGRRALERPLPADFAEANFFERCWVDSFGVVELIEDTEKRFGVALSQTELDDPKFGSVIGFATIVADAVSRSARK